MQSPDPTPQRQLDSRTPKNIFSGAPSFPFSHRLERLVFSIVWLFLARFTPPAFSPWRVFLLNRFGAKIHLTARIYGSAQIWYPKNLHVGPNSIIGPHVKCYSMAKIEIAAYAVISQNAYLCAGSRDIEDINFGLKCAPIKIEKRAWVASEAFVGAGVTVGQGAVLGARAVAFSNLEPAAVYVGNPAQKIKSRTLSDTIASAPEY